MYMYIAITGLVCVGACRNPKDRFSHDAAIIIFHNILQELAIYKKDETFYISLIPFV